MAEREKVAHRLVYRGGVVARDPREAESLDRRVDQDRRKPACGEPRVVVVARGFLRVEAACEHHAGNLLLEEQVDVVRLRDPAGGLRAQDRREALLGKCTADDLREGREDRVLELRQDEPDEPGALAAQLRRPLVAKHVERGQDRLAG